MTFLDAWMGDWKAKVLEFNLPWLLIPIDPTINKHLGHLQSSF